MSTNKLSHLKEWEKIYLEVTRTLSYNDDAESLVFKRGNRGMYIDDDDTFYTLEGLKQLANDGMPKQEITIDGSLWDRWSKVNFKWTLKTLPEKGYILNWSEVVHSEVSVFVRNQYGWISKAMSYAYPPKKTELTLAEVEEKLGIERWTLKITDCNS